MSKQCEVCGKKPIKVYGQTKKMTVCTSCLKAGKVQKAV